VYRSFIFVVLAALSAAGCRTDATAEPPPPAAAAVTVAAVVADATPMARYIEVTGTLTAQESADVAAEIAGRIEATPVERGSRVGAGEALVRIGAADVDAQAREAEANAAQIEARLGIAGGQSFDVARVPEVASAGASRALARAEFERTRALHADQLVSRAEFDQKSAQRESAERQYDVARNGAEQQYQSLMAARARVTVARKAAADAVVRAPFAGLVGERFVSAGDFVTRGTRVASVLRVDALRVELTVPEQYVAAVATGRPVTFTVDAFPGTTFTGQVRYVSPSVTAESRALVVEALVPNPDGALKPGFFATARIEQAGSTMAVLVPAGAIRTVAGTARLFVVDGDHVEERVVMVGQAVGDRREIASGLTPGERVVTSGVAALADGTRVVVR